MRKCGKAALIIMLGKAGLLALMFLGGCDLETPEDEWDIIDQNIASTDAADTADDTPLILDDETSDSDDMAPLSDQRLAGSDNERTAFRFFVNKGLTRIQSAGIIGNLMQESTMRPTAIAPDNIGHGIAQWSKNYPTPKMGRWNRDFQDNVVWYAKLHHFSRWELELQLRFIWYELTFYRHHVDPYEFKQLKKAESIHDAVLAFQKNFERCDSEFCDTSKRLEFARQALKMF